MKTLIIILSILIFSKCNHSEPGTQYKVQVIEINTWQNNPKHYCTYYIKVVDGPKPPRNYFVNTCGMYTVDQIITIEMNKL